MTLAPVTTLSAGAAAAAIRAGALSSEGLVRACLERCGAREPSVHAWAHLDAGAALAQARARDAQPPRGPLHGVPVGIKDLIDTGDQPTSYGSPLYAGHRPERDATCVVRMRAAGAVILGKTVTTEFALFSPGPTSNPHDRARTPGGSSSGSAAAVADGMVPLALGTQTAGSIVRPASYCGVIGGKPSLGAVPTAGVKPISPSLDTVGAFTRDFDDLALAWSVLRGHGATEWSAPSPQLAWARTPEWPLAAPHTQRVIATVSEQLHLPEITLPTDFAGLVAAQTAIMEAEAAEQLTPEWRSHGDLLSAQLRALLARGQDVTAAQRSAAHQLAVDCRRQLSTVFAQHRITALVVPSVRDEAPVGLHATGDPVFCRTWTLLGAPAIAVPGLTGPTGLPLGVQVVALPGRDGDALAAARWLAPHLTA